MVAIAEARNWTYKLYEEIGSGESIAKRKKMQQLLIQVDNGMFDGVLVMDIDRLGRGGYYTAMCVYTYPDGTKCQQVGRKLDNDFYKALYQKIIKIDKQTLEMVEETNEQCQELEALLEVKQRELAQTEKAIEKMLDLYEDGMITKQRFFERIGGHEKTKSELEAEIEKCNLALAAQVHWVTVEMIQNRIDEFKDLWSSAITPGEQNRAYRLLIDRIVYDREENGVTLEVLYK